MVDVTSNFISSLGNIVANCYTRDQVLLQIGKNTFSLSEEECSGEEVEGTYIYLGSRVGIQMSGSYVKCCCHQQLSQLCCWCRSPYKSRKELNNQVKRGSATTRWSEDQQQPGEARTSNSQVKRGSATTRWSEDQQQPGEARISNNQVKRGSATARWSEDQQQPGEARISNNQVKRGSTTIRWSVDQQQPGEARISNNQVK